MVLANHWSTVLSKISLVSSKMKQTCPNVSQESDSWIVTSQFPIIVHYPEVGQMPTSGLKEEGGGKVKISPLSLKKGHCHNGALMTPI